MKYCSKPFNNIYFDNLRGDVWFCPWMKEKLGIIGNILNESFEEIWCGEKAEKIRDKFRQNSFELCRMVACPHLQNNDLPEIEDMESYNEWSKTPERPGDINLAYDSVCNQYCETCRPKVFTPYEDYPEKMAKIKDKIVPYLDTANYISMSGHGDPFASPYMMDLLTNLKPANPNIVINLETNGVFFDEQHWEKIQHLKDFNMIVVLTSNSYDPFTYKHISRGGNYEKLMNNLKFIKILKEKNYINTYSSSFVIQDRNFREIPSFIERSLNEFGFDSVVLKPVYQWGKMPDDVYWFKDVLNPKHPYHQEYLEIMQHPSLKDPKVYNFAGDSVHPAVDYPAS